MPQISRLWWRVLQAGDPLALKDLLEREYGEKYAGRGEPAYLIGVEFSRQDRNIVGLEVETFTAER